MTVFREMNTTSNNKGKVIAYKKLKDIQEYYSSYITSPVVVPDNTYIATLIIEN